MRKARTNEAGPPNGRGTRERGSRRPYAAPAIQASATLQTLALACADIDSHCYPSKPSQG